MKKRYRLFFVIPFVILSLFFVVSCGSKGVEMAASQENLIATSIPEKKPEMAYPPPTHAAPIINDNSEVLQSIAENIAPQLNISVEEAIRRLKYQDMIDFPVETVMKEDVDTFGGSWLQQEGEFRFVITATRDVEKLAEKYHVFEQPWADVVELRTVKYSLNQLMQDLEIVATITQKIEDIAKKEQSTGLLRGGGLEMTENSISIETTDLKKMQQIMQDHQLVFPQSVIFIEVDPNTPYATDDMLIFTPTPEK